MSKGLVDKNYIKQILDQCHNPSPKSELLPYQYYDKDNNLFINTGSNMGFLLELNPIVGVTESILKQVTIYNVVHTEIWGIQTSVQLKD